MPIEVNEKIAVLATVVSDGELEVFQREPFMARLGGRRLPTVLQTFVFEPAGITVLDMFIPVAQVPACAAVDRWIARVAPGLFNVHVAARDMEGATFVEARTSLVADRLTMETFARVPQLVVTRSTDAAALTCDSAACEHVPRVSTCAHDPTERLPWSAVVRWAASRPAGPDNGPK